MAVMQAARLRSTALPAASSKAPAVRARTSATTAVRSATGVRPVGLFMAGILVSTMLGLAYLTQTLGSNATSSEISKLQADRAGLDTDLRRQSIHLMNLTESDAVIDRARAQGLHSLGEPLVLRAP